ncbi:flagellar hook-basal body complex protein FliE [Clostridium sp. 19966]|uniref:flagellar hook-basal body complex protein FliE n=1 Tax=Clostridium sp. 19966 TaxID=2768166 RepID=UPI0028DF0C08|nr:flagellar hook-basal body complex protein FliE [Clostridium sp. 19966]MDT8716658.1 flagellar hook-basal body complex protein FliE [Clostridium sp. 19966]
MTIDNLQKISSMSLGNDLTSSKSDDSNTNGVSSFLDLLNEKLNDVNDQQIQADQKTESFIKGDSSIDIQDLMVSTEEAKQSLQMAIQVRNKIVEAYQELDKMQL